jgi:hypothetical protein
MKIMNLMDFKEAPLMGILRGIEADIKSLIEEIHKWQGSP